MAFSSAAMIITGGIMNLGGQRNALAESLSTLSILFSVSAEIRGAGSVECLAKVLPENGSSLTYSVQWRSPGGTWLEVRRANTVVKTLDLSEQGIKIADPIEKTQISVDNLGQVTDPLFQPVMDLLSGDILAEKLNMRWRLKGHELRDEREETFLFNNPEQGTLVDMRIDLNSRRPVTMQTYLAGPGDVGLERRPVLSVRFFWNRRLKEDRT